MNEAKPKASELKAHKCPDCRSSCYCERGCLNSGDCVHYECFTGIPEPEITSASRPAAPGSSCSYDPSVRKGPIGMFHCPECGEMVVAGIPHPNYSEESDIAIIALDGDNEVSPGDSVKAQGSESGAALGFPKASELEFCADGPTDAEADAYLRGLGIIKRCAECGQDATLTNEFVTRLTDSYAELAEENRRLRERRPQACQGCPACRTQYENSRRVF